MNITEILRKIAESAHPADIAFMAVGFTLLAIWLYRTSLAATALANSAPRRNNMHAYMPFVPLFIAVLTASIAIALQEKLLPNLSEWQSEFYNNASFCIGAVIAIAVIIYFAKKHFTRGLKGFGLRFKTIPKDLAAAIINLITIAPLIIIAVQLTLFIGMLIYGPDFQLTKHDQLQSIALYTQLPLQIIIVITTIVIAPIFEELLFRGLFQTMIGSFLAGSEFADTYIRTKQPAWLAIVCSSIIFASIHANISHRLALFVLAMCLGYAYEKSGSIIRPIFIHIIFNAINIITALNKA